MGALGAIKASPESPLPRKAREIPPKSGVSQVQIYIYTTQMSTVSKN